MRMQASRWLEWRWARSLYRKMLGLRLRLWVREDTRVRVEHAGGRAIVVLPGVFGVRLRTGAFLAQTLNARVISAGTRVLDLGTGSGIGALWAAALGGRVVATDINPEAVRCARINALAHHLEDKIETRLGDLFEPVPGQRFDLILFNPPFYRGQPRDMRDRAWRSLDVFDRFLQELPAHLAENGCAWVVLSSDGDIADALPAARHLRVGVVRRKDFINEVLTVYEIRPKREDGTKNRIV